MGSPDVRGIVKSKIEMEFKPFPKGQLLQIPDASEIHVWLIRLDDLDAEAHLRDLLADDERDRAERFRFDLHRRRFVIARGTLREILGNYLAIQPSEIRFVYGPKGKPALAFPEGIDLQFNLSHSGELALAAFTVGKPLGVDIEQVRPMDDLESIVRDHFSAMEIEQWQSLPSQARVPAFFDCWTRKEAYVKAIGDGLSAPLNEFDVAFLPLETPAIAFKDKRHRESWSLIEMSPAPQFAGALAIPGCGWKPECWTWEPVR